MEKVKAQKLKTVTSITIQVLAAIAFFGGVMVIATITPNLPGALFKLFGGKRNLDQERWQRTLKRLERRGYLAIKNEGKTKKIVLTRSGVEKVTYWQAQQLTIPKPKKWDGKWRLVAFDIPEKKKIARDVFRSTLKRLGFFQLQKSLFVHPYPCTDEIDYIGEIYEIKPFVVIAVIDTINQSYRLVRHFELG